MLFLGEACFFSLLFFFLCLALGLGCNPGGFSFSLFLFFGFGFFLGFLGGSELTLFFFFCLFGLS